MGQRVLHASTLRIGRCSYRISYAVSISTEGARGQNPESVPPQTCNGQPDTGRPTVLQSKNLIPGDCILEPG